MSTRNKKKLSRGQWAVECERLQIPREQRQEPSNQTASIQDVLPGTMKNIGLESRFWEESLIEEWKDLVGPQLVRYTRPGRFDRKILHVFVTNSAWLSELSRFGKHELLKKLQKRFGADKIRDIRLQLDPDRR